jgi:glycerol-3-phosphate responsive antiterminator
MSETTGIDMPRLFEASDGRGDWRPPKAGDVGLLLRDTNLAALVANSGRSYPVAVDIDSVEGLSDDRAACEFLVRRLGFTIVLAHHMAAAANIADLGALALLRVFAVDSSGLRTSLESHPAREGIGSAVSPGLVLPHLGDDALALLPRPILAYGLLDRPADIAACMRRADSVALGRDALRALSLQGLEQLLTNGPRNEYYVREPESGQVIDKPRFSLRG